MTKNIEVTFREKACTASIGGKQYKCAVGENGVTHDKVEGDKATPIGTFSLKEVYYRSDKIFSTIQTQLPIRALTENDGWCDDPKSEYYNKHVNLQLFDRTISHEDLYRKDDVYDIIVVVGYNDSPPIPYKGSAIFMHVAREGYSPTDGCIAFSQTDLVEIIGQLEEFSNIQISN